MKVHVASPSFCRHPILRQELQRLFPGARLHGGGHVMRGEELVGFLEEADAAIIGTERVDGELLSRCPSLKFIAKYGVGMDNIDEDACSAAGVRVAWKGGLNALSVAELTLWFMIGLFRKAAWTARLLHQGQWHKDGGTLLAGKTIGVIGVGAVGQELVRLLRPFGCRLLGNDIADRREFYAEHGMEEVSKEDIYAGAHLVTLHVPLTAVTRNMIGPAALLRFRPGAFLVNTSRGAVVDEVALADALKSGHLAGAALDVFREEPVKNAALVGMSGVIATPHVGGNAEEVVLAMGRSALDFLLAHDSRMAGE